MGTTWPILGQFGVDKLEESVVSLDQSIELEPLPDPLLAMAEGRGD